MVKPIILYAAGKGPNPRKVAILLEELGLPYETEMRSYAELKEEPFISLNPNGRVPAIQDPNTGITLAESGAILQYLVDEYDVDNKLHSPSGAGKYAELQWLHFQMSGQGPYFGQKAWFANFHHEKLPSAELRYANEIRRVLGVIDAHLTKQGTPYLTGDRVTYADLAWIPWDELVGWMMPDLDTAAEFPRFAEWHAKLIARPAVARYLEKYKENEKANQ